jgi:hypothetical protein
VPTSLAGYSPPEAVKLASGFGCVIVVAPSFGDFQSKEPVRRLILWGTFRSPSFLVCAHQVDPQDTDDYRRHSIGSALVQRLSAVGMPEVF